MKKKDLLDVNTGKTYKKSVITQTETPTINTINYLKSMVNFYGNQNNKLMQSSKQSLFERKPVFLCGPGHIVDDNGKILGNGGRTRMANRWGCYYEASAPSRI